MSVISDELPAVQSVPNLVVVPKPVMVSNRATRNFAALVRELRQFWRPRTIEADARGTWEYWRHPQSLKTDRLIEQFQTLPDDLKIPVLAEADAVIESHSVDEPWSSSLINYGHRTYKYHCDRRPYGARALDISACIN